MTPTETPRYRLECCGTDPEWSRAWHESFGTYDGPAVDWDEAVRLFQAAVRVLSEQGFDEMIYRVVQV